MKTGLDMLAELVEAKRARLAEAKGNVSPEALRAVAKETRSRATSHALRNVLSYNRCVNVIAEIKRASPSSGDLRLRGAPGEVARAYERGGAAAVSVLTEEDYFHGSLEDLGAVRSAVSLPVLRKDFIFDEYQVYEAAAAGADALLLIVALLDDETLIRLRRLVEVDLGMDALVEVHTREEMARASASGANMIGVNNRNLRTFEISIGVSLELAGDAPTNALLVSESGLRNGSQLKQLRQAGYHGFLIGESLIGTESPEDSLRAIIKDAEN
jgi:indole-3-glycerol phosphate synthase